MRERDELAGKEMCRDKVTHYRWEPKRLTMGNLPGSSTANHK